MLITFDSIKQQVEEYAAIIDVPDYLLPTYGYSVHDAVPFVEIANGNQFYYVNVERGEDIKRITAKDLDDLLYLIFDDITFAMATQYELRHRNENEDFRIQLFSYQESLLGKINKDWQLRNHQYHRRLLR